MKKLYLVRHAKSSWKHPDLKDYDRPLNSRGKRDAPEMGKRLERRKILPDLLLASPANRAYSTAVQIGLKIGYQENDIKTNEGLYHADAAELINILKKQDNGFKEIMVFGHNPGFTNLANLLSGEQIDNIPTTGIFAMQFKIEDWNQIDKAASEVLFFDFPKKVSDVKFLS